MRSLLPGLCSALLVLPLAAQETWWAKPVAEALGRAGDNASELQRALRDCPQKQRGSMAFLIEHMPPKDLRRLDAALLLDNVALAHAARDTVPWGQQIPEEVFRNDVLPYCNVSETRENWRRDFHERFLPLVKDCKTPTEAAQLLNKTIFKQLEVKYSTRRRRADQSPSESIAQGLASCTGLSILLTNACRAVAVPARLAGIPSWVNKRGNHTWVEVWDQGWHFTGAAEYNPKGLNRTWFQRDAALAKKDERRHAIYAVSYRDTGIRFPMVWARGADPVHAVNVTDRYTGKQETARKPAGDTTRLLVRVYAYEGGPRVRAGVVVRRLGRGGKQHSGLSHDESKDTNDILSFDLPRRAYQLEVQGLGVVHQRRIRRLQGAQQTVDVHLLGDTDRAVRRAAARYFATPAKDRPRLRRNKVVVDALRADPARVRGLVFAALREAPIHDDLRSEFEAKIVRSGAHESPYLIKSVGTRPAAGWPLFIAMHGGGNTRKSFNDRQWRRMFGFYKEQPDLGYRYISLRAPNDTWNGFYDQYVWPLVRRLIRQQVICGDADPERVYIMGYSHGGYGAFAIGPHLADRFAAVHASAAAPTPGISPAENLRNLRFTYMIGERDTRYQRLKRCLAFDETVQALKDDGPAGDPDWGFDVELEYKAGIGHGGLPDKDKVREMYAYTRNPSPRRVSWVLSGDRIPSFYWLGVSQPAKGQRLEALARDNRIELKTSGVGRLQLFLDERLVDFGTPVEVELNGKRRAHRVRPDFMTLCRTMLERGDPGLARSAVLELQAGTQ